MAESDLANSKADNSTASALIWLNQAEELINKTKGKKLYNEENSQEPHYICVDNQGFIKHAYILAFYFLFKLALKIDGEYVVKDDEIKGYFKESIKQVI